MFGQNYFWQTILRVLLVAKWLARESSWCIFQSFIQRASILGMYKTFFLYRRSSRFVKSRMLLFRSELNSLVANRWVIFFARGPAHKNFGKASIRNLDVSLYMLSFETAPLTCLFWLKNRKSNIPTTKVDLAYSFMWVNGWAATLATEGNNIFWKTKVSSFIELSHSASIW